jgi:hypothetical protein
VPVALSTKIEALRADFRLADLLGVDRAQVTRWLRGGGIDPLNTERLDLLDLVWSACFGSTIVTPRWRGRAG